MYDFAAVVAANERFSGNNGWVVCTMTHGVCIGLWQGGRFVFHKSAAFLPENVMELRVFDDTAELRFVNVNGDMKARFALDGGASGDDVYDTRYLMFGTDVTVAETDENGVTWSCLSEERGGKLWFPKDVSIDEGSVALWLGLHSYLRYNPVYIGDDDAPRQTGKPALEAYDYRYVGFWKGLNNERGEHEGTAKEGVSL